MRCQAAAAGKGFGDDACALGYWRVAAAMRWLRSGQPDGRRVNQMFGVAGKAIGLMTGGLLCLLGRGSYASIHPVALADDDVGDALRGGKRRW